MTEQVNSLFDTGIERYKAGEGTDTLIPLFKDICAQAPKMAAAWTCLAWLYMLSDQPTQAYKAAQKGLKLDASDPQVRINYAMTMLETGQAGVRQHIEVIQQMIANSSELKEQVRETLEEGLTRKPDWKSLNKVKNWLFES